MSSGRRSARNKPQEVSAEPSEDAIDVLKTASHGNNKKKRAAPGEAAPEPKRAKNAPAVFDDDLVENAIRAFGESDADLIAALQSGADPTATLGEVCGRLIVSNKKQAASILQTLKLIVDFGIDWNRADHIVSGLASQYDVPEFIRYFIDQGAIDGPEGAKAWYSCVGTSFIGNATALFDAGWIDLSPGSKDLVFGMASAIRSGNLKMLKFMLDKNVDVNFICPGSKDSRRVQRPARRATQTVSNPNDTLLAECAGETPLILALRSGATPSQMSKVVTMLIEAGANKTFRNAAGETPLQCAQEANLEKILPLLQ